MDARCLAIVILGQLINAGLGSISDNTRIAAKNDPMIARHYMSLLSLIIAASISQFAQGAADERVNFGRDIQPIFHQYCAKCHGAKKAEGDLRLDSSDGIRTFGIDRLLSPGNSVESELLARVTLGEEDESRMPKGSKPLPKQSIELLKRWIDQGADLTLETSKGSRPEQHGEQAEVHVSPAPFEAIQKLKLIGARVAPIYGGSNLLNVSFRNVDSAVGNDKLALLAGIAEQTTWLDISGPKIKATDFSILNRLSNLTQLNLAGTQIEDASLSSLSDLQRLKCLNLYATGVTDSSLEHLKQLKGLRKLYVSKTKFTYEAAMTLQEQIQGLQVNLGWNHPQIVVARLTKELDRVRKTKIDATQRELDARDQKQGAAERETEVLDELKKLTNVLPKRPTEVECEP
jgi:hypothetical protein